MTPPDNESRPRNPLAVYPWGAMIGLGLILGTLIRYATGIEWWSWQYVGVVIFSILFVAGASALFLLLILRLLDGLHIEITRRQD